MALPPEDLLKYHTENFKAIDKAIKKIDSKLIAAVSKKDEYDPTFRLSL